MMMLLLLATVCLNVYLYTIVPEGLLPAAGYGRLVGGIQADQGISFQAMRQKLASFVDHRAAATRPSKTSSASPAAFQRNSAGSCSSR